MFWGGLTLKHASEQKIAIGHFKVSAQKKEDNPLFCNHSALN